MNYCLKDLADLTLQDIFDVATEHLLFQFAKCSRGVGCYYRYEDKKCAFGVFISDEEYNKTMEGVGASAVIKRFGVPSEVLKNDLCKMDLCNDLQGIHDYSPIYEWAEELYDLAVTYELISPILQEKT